MNPKFAILILTYNNERYARKNLESALCQEYPHFRIILCNDASTDRTAKIVEHTVSRWEAHDRVTVIHNGHRNGALANIYEHIHAYIADDEIVVMLDGDDELADPHVLTRLAHVYQAGDIWLTYGQYRCKSSEKLGSSRPIDPRFWQAGTVRQHQKLLTLGHPRTFYAWLFKRIARKDLSDGGQFYPMSYDVAIMVPMLEMARYHYRFLDDILYIYNDENPISDHRVNWPLQRRIADHILAQPAYDAL